MLRGYIQHISAPVVEEALEDTHNKLSIKINFERERLEMDHVRLKNQLEVSIQRLNYLLEIANAARIKKPIYSNGRAVKDGPDFSISLGVDGVKRKLEIEKSVTDVVEANDELCNHQYHTERLLAVSVGDVAFTSSRYQLSPPSLVKKDGPAKSMVVTLATLLGGMVVCGGVLSNHAVIPRRQKMAFIDQQLV